MKKSEVPWVRPGTPRIREVVRGCRLKTLFSKNHSKTEPPLEARYQKKIETGVTCSHKATSIPHSNRYFPEPCSKHIRLRHREQASSSRLIKHNKNENSKVLMNDENKRAKWLWTSVVTTIYKNFTDLWMIYGNIHTSFKKPSPLAGLAMAKYRSNLVERDVFFTATAFLATARSSEGLPTLSSPRPVTNVSL